MRHREFEGKDLQEAITTAAAELDIPEQDLHYEIVEQGRRGLLGLGARSVRIRVKPPLDDLDDESVAEEGATGPHAQPVERRSTVAPELAEKVEDTLQRILELMGLEVDARCAVGDGGVTVELEGPDRKRLTGKNGELLSALQLLVNRMSRRAWPGVGRIHIHCDGGRVSRRDDDIMRMAREAAQHVARTGRTQKLNPLNAYERRLVHITIREFSGLTSSSDGQGALKSIRVSKVRSDTLKR